MMPIVSGEFGENAGRLMDCSTGAEMGVSDHISEYRCHHGTGPVQAAWGGDILKLCRKRYRKRKDIEGGVQVAYNPECTIGPD